MTLLGAFVDTDIKFKSDKSKLLDQSWTSGVQPYFLNAGKAFQNIKKLKEAIDFHATQEKSWGAVLPKAMMKNILGLYNELCNQQAVLSQNVTLGNFASCLIERLMLHNEYRLVVFGI